MKIGAEHGTSLVVQWLRILILLQGVWFQSLIRELRSHIAKGQLSLCAAMKTQHSQQKRKDDGKTIF